jgi:outer membrane protein
MTFTAFPIRVTVMLTALAVRVTAGQAPPTVRLTLGEAARAAAQHSAAADMARVRVDEAKARVTQARSALLPNFSGSVLQSGHTFNTVTFGITFPSAPGSPPLFDPNGQIEGPVNLLDLRGKVTQSLYDASARARVRASEVGITAASADAASVADQAASAAAMAYVTAQRADALLRSRIADSTLSAELLGIARDLLQAGVGIALDVTRAQSQLAGIRAQLIGARNDKARSRLELLRAVGLALDTPVELADSLVAPDVDVTVDEPAAVDAAVRQRPDVRAVEEQINALRHQVTAIQAERLPTLGLFGDDGLIGGTAAHLLPTYTWGIQLSLPIFDGHQRSGRVEEQSAMIREVEIRERDLRAEIAVEVRSAMLDLSSAREQVDAARERVQLSEQELTQARDRFSAGVAGNADVISASLSLSGARTSLVEAEAAYQGARVSLARAEGIITSIK